ncbi:MAG: thioredoxin family protein [Sphingobacteriaceae bacterium]|nr:thioredoxin family protein [Sphingobacteriaceae bacterium]
MALTLATDQNFNQLLQDNSLVLVKYYADWCGNCKLIAPKVRRISEEEQYAGIAFIDINAEENPEARKTAGVDNLPYFAAFKNGELVGGSAASKIEFVQELIANKLLS